LHHRRVVGIGSDEGGTETVELHVAVRPFIEEERVAAAAVHFRRLGAEPARTCGIAGTRLFELSRDFPGSLLLLRHRGECREKKETDQRTETETHGILLFLVDCAHHQHTTPGTFRARVRRPVWLAAGHEFRTHECSEVTMLKLALIFFLIGLAAALLGFTGIAGASFAIAKIFAILFGILFLVFLILGLSAASRIAA